MEYFDSGVNRYAIGSPDEAERKQLLDDGYMLMTSGIDIDNNYFEIWIK